MKILFHNGTGFFFTSAHNLVNYCLHLLHFNWAPKIVNFIWLENGHAVDYGIELNFFFRPLSTQSIFHK